MAVWRFHIYNHDQPFHKVNFGVSSYFQFSFFNDDSNLLLLCTCKVARHFQSIMWKCPCWPTKNATPSSHYNTLFVCFFILLVNTIVIFHQEKWFTSTIKFLEFFFFNFAQKNKLQKQWNFWKKLYTPFQWKQISSMNLSTRHLLNHKS